MQGTSTQIAQPQYEITDADKKRVAQIARAWQAFDDELEGALEPMPGEDPEIANIGENIVSSCVEDVLSFLFGDKVEISVDKGSPQEAQDALDQAWGRKETRLPLLQELGQNGLVSGQGFLRIVPNRDGSIQLRAIDPSIIFVRTAREDCKSVDLYCIEYSCEEQAAGGKPVQQFYREEIRRIDPISDDTDQYEDVNADGQDQNVSWELQHWTRVGDRGLWTRVGDPIPWPYSYCPIQSCQNLVKANLFWGKPDTTKGLIVLNKAINFVLSNINKIGKIYAEQILWGTGFGEQIIDRAPGKIIGLPPDGKIDAVQISSDTPNQLRFLEKLHSAVERQTSVPSLASGVTENMPHQVTGVALKTMCMALLKLVDKKRCLYGGLIINVSKAILQLKGFSPGIDITIGWQNPLPSDGATDVQEAIGKNQLGVSKTTLLRELGYDPDQEAELRAQEDAQQNVAFSRGQGFPPPSPQQQPPAQPDQQPGQEQQSTGASQGGQQ